MIFYVKFSLNNHQINQYCVPDGNEPIAKLKTHEGTYERAQRVRWQRRELSILGL